MTNEIKFSEDCYKYVVAYM